MVANFQPLWAYADAYVTDLTLPFISRQTASYMYSIASMGSLEVGKRANLAVLDRNLFEIPPSEMSDDAFWHSAPLGS